MNNTDQIKKLKKQFHDEYGDKFAQVGNNLAVGIGKDANSGEYTIEARLINLKLKDTLPANYYGVKVNVSIVGNIVAC